MKRGLVMEGGSMRGMFTAGVTDVWMEHGIEFDGAVGVSAGALFGCNYKSRQIGRAVRYNKRFANDRRYASLHSLITTGDLYNRDFCYHVVPRALDPFDTKAFTENPMEFYLVCTDIRTGKPVYHQCFTGDDTELDWFRASGSLPLAATPVEIDGQLLMDGGISDSIPLRWFESIGYDRNVLILTRPPEYRKEKNKLLPLLRLMCRQYPALIHAMERRHIMYNATVEDIRSRGDSIYVVQPDSPLDVKVVERDPERLEAVYQQGRAAGLAHLEGVKRFLEK